MQATEIVEKPMKMPEVRVKARSLGLTPGRKRKAELIHAIQMAEGYSHFVFGLPPAGEDEVLPMLDRYAALAEKLRA